MNRIRKYGLVILALLSLLLGGCSRDSGTGASGGAALVIPLSELSAEPRFYDHSQDGTPMQIIALKNSAGDVQLAYNTCQACAGSPYAYFEYQDGVLVCQNCWNRFGLESVGKTAGGCNPMPVTGYETGAETVTIPAEALAKAAPSFRNWKVIR